MPKSPPKRAAFTRPYDVAMSPALLTATKLRRTSPDGSRLEVGTAARHTPKKGRHLVLVYPWNQMKLGDFFFVPLGNRYRDRLDVRFRQAAARRDWELTITAWELDGEPHLRVCLTCVGVTALKKKAQHQHHVPGIKYSDGRWSARRKKAAKQKRKETRLGVATGFNLPGETGPMAVPKLGPSEPILAIDVAIATAPVDATFNPAYDRAAVLKERLAKLGVG